MSSKVGDDAEAKSNGAGEGATAGSFERCEDDAAKSFIEVGGSHWTIYQRRGGCSSKAKNGKGRHRHEGKQGGKE